MLSSILESVYFLFHVMADVEEGEVDGKKRKLIDFVFEKWEQNTTCSYDFVPENGNIENIGNYRESALQRFSDYVKNDSPYHMRRDAVEFLSNRFSFYNMHAFLHDLREIANADGIFSEEEQTLIQYVCEIWNISESAGPEKPSENDRKLKYSNYCNFFRLKREAELADLLGTAFQVDALAPLVQNFEKTTFSNIFSQRLNIGLEVGDLLAPRLEKLLKEVCQKLEIEEDFELLLCNEPSPNAMIYASISQHGKNLLVVSSALVRSFSDDEIRFVLGHEIAHWIFNANEITSLLVESYDDKAERTPSLNLQYLIKAL